MDVEDVATLYIHHENTDPSRASHDKHTDIYLKSPPKSERMTSRHQGESLIS